jgi:Flp pilus assembly protein TadG
VKRRASRQRAQALMEFAIVFPLFLLLMLVLIDFSRALFTYISLTNSTREMARVAALSINSSSSNAVDAFNNSLLILGPQASGSVAVKVGDATCARAVDGGESTCTAMSTVTCDLPLSQTCTVPDRHQDGFVQVDVHYDFYLNPLFQNRLTNYVGGFFLPQQFVLTTGARAYVE